MKIDIKNENRGITAYIGLGSNIGDREQYLHAAIRQLNEHKGISVKEISAIYETDPVGPVPQDAFLNMAAKLETTLSPDLLLESLLQTEKELGRVRLQKWGPRTIDLDLLLYDQLKINQEHLIVPHPRMWERAFVLVPLSDIIRFGEDPRLDRAIRELSSRGETNGVRLWKVVNWLEEFELSAN